MSDLKHVLSELMKNEEFSKKFEEICKNESDPEKARLLVIKLASEYGVDIDDPNFVLAVSPNKELSKAEVAALSGGADCYCVLGGGSSGEGWTCACVVAGTYEDSNGHSCTCVLGGAGTNLED